LLLEPLSKFPVIADLIVDRSIIYEQLIRAQAYLDQYAASDKGQYEQQYSVAKCLKCGLCLEVCPNYHPGGEFFGAILANESYLIASQSAEPNPQIIKEYKTHFGAGCSKALSCQSVCPMEIETISSIIRMNRK
jgi:succinate dehydrogenase / fumarate reductase iron-sulfur subunit